jgi:PAS domain S-box-containing protein
MTEPSSVDQLAYLSALLDHVVEAIVACDANWRVTAWNEGARRIFGWTAEEAVGRLGTFFGLDESDGEPMARRRQLAEHDGWSGEVAVMRKDGSEVRVESFAVAIRDEQGSISRYLGIHRDLTERGHAEEALRLENRRAETILERISDTFFAVDDQWRYTYLNDRALAQARKARGRQVGAEDLLGKNCWDLFPEAVGTTFDRELRRAVREQKVVAFETSSVVTGESVEVRAYPSKHGLSVYSLDTTERTRAREHLGYHASLLDNIEDGVIATNASDFRITAWNRGAERLYGFTAADVLGRPAREIASYPGDESRLELEHDLRETGRARIEFVAHRKGGTPVRVELIAVEVKDDRGETTGYLGIHRDVSERMRAEEQLESRLGQQAAVAKLGLKALEDGDLGPLMDEAVTLVCRTLEVDYAKVDELLPGGQRLLVRAGAGLRDGVVGSCTMPTGRGSPAGYALMIGAPVIVEDMAAEARFEVPTILREHGVMSDITVVIHPRGNPFGALVAMSKNRRSFSEDDVGFMQAVANVLATAVERAKGEQRLEAAREAERDRIARALHDDALQGLADAIAVAAMADRTTPESGLAGRLLPVLRRTGEQLRSAIYDLRLGSEEHTPFVELLERLVDGHRAMVECEIQLEVGDGVPTGSLGVPGIEVLRILGEALTNARRHAEARRVRVRVWGANDRLWAEVSDDGRGFVSAIPASPTHQGIRGMRERAELLNGRLEIHSAPGRGTRVRLDTPLVNGTRGNT